MFASLTSFLSFVSSLVLVLCFLFFFFFFFPDLEGPGIGIEGTWNRDAKPKRKRKDKKEKRTMQGLRQGRIRFFIFLRVRLFGVLHCPACLEIGRNKDGTKLSPGNYVPD